MLVPVVRFCIRHSVKLNDVVECCKAVFLRVAEEESARAGAKLTASRLAVMTGVHRKDVTRLTREGTKAPEERSIIVRVLGQWQTDSRFVTPTGMPRVLSVGTADSDFHTLVFSVTSDVPPASILAELERTGSVRVGSRGARLLRPGFIPKGDHLQGLVMASTDVADLLESAQMNLVEEPKVPNLHVKVEYDNIVREAEPEIRKWFLEKGTAFHREAMHFVARFDKDVNQKLSGKEGGLRVAIGGYSITGRAHPSGSIRPIASEG